MTHIPIAITGPTASGKSALAVELAIRLGGEVVSCDSMQIYKGMDIGTAKPAKEEMRGVPHHMIDIVSAGQLYSACDYARDAEIAVSDIQGRGKIPVFCGGTGLYLESYMYGASPEASPDNEYREELMGFHKEKGAQALHALLAEKDPIAAASIHPNNTKAREI